MEAYKQLNKQLIAQVQDMRIKEREYRQEIAAVWEMVMDEKNQRIELRSRLVKLLVNNFRSVLEEINPEQNIKQLFDANDDGGVERTSSTRSSSGGGGACSALQRRCSLTKSSKTHHSMKQKSPIRRDGGGGISSVLAEDLSETTETGVIERDDEEGEKSSEEEKSNITNTLEVTMDLVESDVTVRDGEESDKSPGEKSNTTEPQELGMDLVDAIASESTGNIVKPPQLVTISEADEQEEIEVRSRRYKRRNVHVLKVSALHDTNTTDTRVEENISTSSSSEETHSPYIVARRGKQRQNRSSNKVINKSIELPRFCNENIPRIIEPSQNIETREKENMTLLSTSDALSELTMCNFMNAPSSTPRNLRNASGSSQMKTELESINLTSRPSRRCKPTNLVEGSLRQKLRNDSGRELRTKKK